MGKHSGICIATIISALSLLISVACFFMILEYCYPNLEQDIKSVFMGFENNPVQQAFRVMADGFEEGEPIRSTMRETVTVLFE